MNSESAATPTAPVPEAIGQRPLRTFLMWLVLACLLPGVIGAVALIVHEYRLGRSQLEQDTIQTARAMLLAVDTEILRVLALAQGLAASSSLARGDLASFHREAGRALEQSRLGATVLLADRDNRQILHSAEKYGTPLPPQPFPEVIRRVFATGQPVVSDLFVGSVIKRPVIAVVVPVVRSGEVAYALTVGVLPENFEAILLAQGLPPGWVGTVFDSSGTIVARSREHERFSGQKPADNYFERMLEHNESTFRAVMKDGVSVLSAQTRSAATGWRVAISIPYETLLGGFVRRLSMLAWGVAVLFAIGFALAWWMSGRLARSFRTLTAPALALGAGEAFSPPRVEVKEASEIAEAMDRAARLLRERSARLEDSNRKLREKERELDEAHDLARFGVWTWDLQTGNVTFSKSLRDIFGRDLPPFHEQKGTLLTDESWERVREAAERIEETGGYDLELQAYHADGRLLWVNAKCTALRRQDGQIHALRGSLLDITERKLADEKLRASESKYRTLFINMTEAFGLGEPILDPHGLPTDIRFLEVNGAFYEQTGIPQGVEGRPLREVLPRVEQSWIDRYCRVASTGEAMRFESYNHDTSRHYEVYAFSPSRGRFATLFRDVTVQKRTQEALLDSEQRYRALFDNKTTGVAHHTVVSNADGDPIDSRIEAINETYEQMLGVRREDVVGRLVSEVFPTLREGEFDPVAVFGRIGLEGGEGSFEFLFPPTRQWLSVYVYCPKPGQFTAIFSDISAQRSAEAALRESEFRLALALKAGGTAVWEMDAASGEVASASELLFAMLGFERDELRTAADWMALVHEADRPAAEELIRAVLDGQQDNYWSELRVRAKDGSWRWLLSQAVAAERDEQGRAVRLVGTHTDITERKVAEQRVREAALHDNLTGLPNRALIFEFGSHLLAGARRNHGRGALLFVDLDRFKPINDQYGHEVGDRVLKEVAQRLLSCTRHEDLVGRLSGDEFVIILPHLDAGRHRAAVVAEHIVARVSEPIRVDGRELAVSPSIGMSYYPEHAVEIGDLIHAADLAMYQAKQAGRANYQFYTPELEQRSGQAGSLGARVKHALEHGGFTLHYQPVVDLASGRLTGAEALVRLDDDEGNRIDPVRFIPAAEAAGLIGELGEWVVTEACRQQEAWLRDGMQIAVSINVSPLQFRQRDFADKLGSIISHTGVDPSCVQVEVSESAVMESLDEAVGILNRIKSLGVKVALDDFGTGYSSLSSLSTLPVDRLKVDQSFVRQVESDQTSRAVTQAIIALGRSLKLEVIGEGIESEDALRYLREQGCNQAQGYLFSKPLPPSEFADWYREKRATGMK